MDDLIEKVVAVLKEAYADDSRRHDGAIQWRKYARAAIEACGVEQLTIRVKELEGHVHSLIGLVEANIMPLSKDEYRYVQEARASLSKGDVG